MNRLLYGFEVGSNYVCTTSERCIFETNKKYTFETNSSYSPKKEKSIISSFKGKVFDLSNHDSINLIIPITLHIVLSCLAIYYLG